MIYTCSYGFIKNSMDKKLKINLAYSKYSSIPNGKCKNLTKFKRLIKLCSQVLISKMNQFSNNLININTKSLIVNNHPNQLVLKGI
jgi:hypothetical protein